MCYSVIGAIKSKKYGFTQDIRFYNRLLLLWDIHLLEFFSRFAVLNKFTIKNCALTLCKFENYSVI